MKPKFRLATYLAVGFPIPLLSWILFPEYGWQAPVFWMAFTVTLAGIYEVINARKK